ncbi:DUF1822 family protein [Pantanalinema rosaneae CENA516]|uniref:DUF1822 family protein n=1 Tax=Pantanalinema rosaneae TaxID=1620701 RepID=UPI003D6EF1FD
MLTFDPSTVWLEIPQAIQTEFWQQIQTIARGGDRWQVYQNHVCLHTILPWLQEKAGESAVEVDSIYNPHFWQLVHGSAVTLGATRLILIPVEAMDKREFRVPQEWIDIPRWVGDYYLAVEVDADEQTVHVWGYTTHHHLKTQGHYDASDRTYSLDGNDVIQDLSVLWVMLQLASEVTRAEVTALPRISLPAAILIEQVGDPAILSPRLAIPFTEWGALIEDECNLQQFCARRQFKGSSVSHSVPSRVNLGQWLQHVFESGWQSLEEVFTGEPDLAFSFRQPEALEAWLRRVKRVQLGRGLPTVLLLVMLKTEADQRRNIWVQIMPWIGEQYLPANLQLTLLSTTGETLQSVQSSEQSNYIQLRRFKCPLGRQFRLQIAIANRTFSEEFIA